jgi:branched-chain amino acid transport system permease protein
MMIRAGASNREMVQSLGIDITVPVPRGLRRRRGAGRAGRHGRRAHVLGVPGHGQPGADHLLRGGGDRRHRLDPRCAAGALLVGVVDTFGKVLLPQAAGVLVYVLMALILLWRPTACSRQAEPHALTQIPFVAGVFALLAAYPLAAGRTASTWSPRP